MESERKIFAGLCASEAESPLEMLRIITVIPLHMGRNDCVTNPKRTKELLCWMLGRLLSFT